MEILPTKIELEILRLTTYRKSIAEISREVGCSWKQAKHTVEKNRPRTEEERIEAQKWLDRQQQNNNPTPEEIEAEKAKIRQENTKSKVILQAGKVSPQQKPVYCAHCHQLVYPAYVEGVGKVPCLLEYLEKKCSTTS